MTTSPKSVNQGGTGPIIVNQRETQPKPDEKCVIAQIVSAASGNCPWRKQGSVGESDAPEKNVATLFTLAKLACLGKIQNKSDLNHAASYITEMPYGLRCALVQITGDNLREITTSHTANLANDELRMLVAKRRVLNGEPWVAVAREQYIARRSAVIELNKEVLNRPNGKDVLNHEVPSTNDPFVATMEIVVVKSTAGEKVRNGEPCDKVARKYGITHDEAICELQLIAVHCLAGKRVRKGAPCDTVARKYGITQNIAIRQLQLIAVQGRAGEDARRGEPCNRVARKYGITDDEAIRELQLKAVYGVAGKHVRMGAHCGMVAEKYGITQDEAIQHLQLKAVDGKAGKRVRKGAPCDRAARKYGITHPRAILELQLEAVDGKAGKRVRNGVPCDTVAQEYEITHPLALEELRLKATHNVAGEPSRISPPGTRSPGENKTFAILLRPLRKIAKYISRIS